MLKRQIAKLKLLPALLVLALPLFATSTASAATVTLQLSGTPRAATAQEVTAMNGSIDASTTISGRGNVGSLSTSGWDINPARDMTEGKHELAVIQWQPLTIPACAASINVKIDTSITRKAMDNSTTDDSIEWANALFRGSPINPEIATPAMPGEGRYKSPNYGGIIPTGQNVPANQAADFVIPNDKASVNTNFITREDLANGVFSFLYFDVFSPDPNAVGPRNISWFAKINSATVSYEDAACNSNTPDPTPTTGNNNAPASPKTGALAVAGVISIAVLAGLVVTANVLSNKLSLKKKSIR